MPSTLTISDDRRSRGKSPSGRDRDRSHSRDTRPRSPPRRSKKYSESESEESDYERRRREKRSTKKSYDDADDDRHRGSHRRKSESESEDDRYKKSSQRHDDDDRRKSSNKDRDVKSRKKDKESSGSEDINISIHRKSHKEKDERENGRPAQPPPAPYPYGAPAYPPDPRIAYQNQRHASYAGPDPRYDPRYGPDPNAYYLQGHSDVPDHHRTHSISAGSRPSDKDKQYVKTYDSRGKEHLVELQASKGGKDDKKYRDDKYSRRDEEVSVKMSTLAVGGLGGATLGMELSRHGSHDGGRPPASPMLEAYHGTYQSLSPMPGALVLARNDSDVSDLEGLSDDDQKDDLKRKIKRLEREKQLYARQHVKDEIEIDNLELDRISSRHRKDSDTGLLVMSPTGKKSVSFYDPVPDAKKLAAALRGTHNPPKTRELLLILPDLSSDDLFALRDEYKKQVQIAGQGVNLAKHIKMRVTGNPGKVMYATALGRWESEAYFANSYYFSGKVSRELLIESLMGRPNSDIREIKRVFKDKKYDDDLVKCIKAELKADKFRTALLLALEERRALESEGLDFDLVQRDVSNLYRALSAGSETAMIEIIVVRSDLHLREVLRIFEDKYRINFAREMINKSRNLVVSHILLSASPENQTSNMNCAGRNARPHPKRRPQPRDA